MEIVKQTTAYQLNSLISKGGTGKIYSAIELGEDGKTDGLCYAVKVIDGKWKALAAREKGLSQKIEEASCYSIVIPILDQIHTEKREYLIMQLRHQGKFLNELLEEIWGEEHTNSSVIPFRHIKGILSEVLSSLGHMHECMSDTEGSKGFLHLDLHPGNIFLENVNWRNGFYGTAKFIDFQNSVKTESDGFAKIGEDNQPVGFTGGFSAPEVVEKKFDNISVRSDLYSVAAIGMYMLTRQDTDTRTVRFDNVLNELLLFLRESDLVPVAYGYLKQFFQSGLSYFAAYRFSSAKEMSQCLEEVWKLQELYQGEDFYSLFRQAYQMGIAGSQFAAEQFSVSENNFQKAVEKLKNAMLQSDIFVRENQYIFEQLQVLYQKMPKKPGASVCGSLFSSALAIYNHLADHKKCLEMYGKLLELKEEMHVIEDWPTVVNRAAVSYADTFQMEKALLLLEGNIKNLEKVKEAYLSVAAQMGGSEKSVKQKDLGRVYSAYGTYLAYLGQGKPMEYFQKALDEFGADRGNCAITISHILHYLMDCCQRACDGVGKNPDSGEIVGTKEEIYQLFEQWYLRLTNGQSLETRDEIRLFLDTEQKNGYNLWIYLKAVYVFGREDQIPGLAEKIIELMNDRGFYSKEQHPEALILKYCGLLLCRIDREQYWEYAYQAFTTAVQRLEFYSKKEEGELTLFKIFAYHIQSEELIATGEEESAASLYGKFEERLENSGYDRLKDWLEEYNAGRKVPKIALKGEYC